MKEVVKLIMSDINIINANLVSNGDPIPENTIGCCIVIDSCLSSDDDIYIMNEKAKLSGQPMFTHHYFIEKDGSIFSGRDEMYQAYIDEKFNKNCIGIMLQGNFNKEEISQLQFNNLIKLIFDIKERNIYINNAVYLHSELNSDYENTPGQLFPYVEFKNRLYMNFLNLTDKEYNIQNDLICELGSRNLEYKIPNMIGTDIYQLKLYLIKLGFNITNVNGSFDKELYNTVKQFFDTYDINVESYQNNIITSDIIEFIHGLIIRNQYDRSEKYQRYLKITDPLMIGNDIKFLKEKMWTLGLYSGSINTVYDEEFAESIGKFQTKYGYTISKEVASLTFSEIVKCTDYTFSRVLELTEPLMEGPDIEIVQKNLYRLGYSISITGFYDIKTYNAVCQFQIDNNYMIDGRIDEFTFNEILKSK